MLKHLHHRVQSHYKDKKKKKNNNNKKERKEEKKKEKIKKRRLDYKITDAPGKRKVGSSMKTTEQYSTFCH